MVTKGVESKITAYIQSNPQYKEYSREKVVSIMLEKGALTRSEVQSWYRQMEERVKEEHAVSAEVPSQPAKTKTNNQANTSINLFGDSKPISSNSDMGLRVESAAGITPTTVAPQNIEPKVQPQAAEPVKFELTEAQAQNEVINTIMEDVSKSYVLYQKQDNGVVSKGYDALKNYFDSELSSSNVEEALALQATGADNLMLARDGELTKREYYLQNKEHLKKMLTRRLYDKDENTGLDFLDRNRGKLSKEEFGKFLEDYIQRMIDNIPSMDSLKSVMHGLVTSTPEETEENLQKLLANAKKNKPVQVLPDSRAISIKSKGIPLEFDTDEPISFEEVFRYERGTQYSKEKVENVIMHQQEMALATGAVNKHAQFKASAEALIKSEESAEVKRDKVAVLYEKYYGGDINLAKEKLDEVISQGKFMIATKEVNGKLTLDMSAYGTETQQQNILNLLLRFGIQQQDKQLEKVLGGKPEDKMLAINQDYEAAYTNAYGNEFTEELVQAMENDNKSFIRKYTGSASMAGMAMTVVGGILCFTPAAPLGAGLITAGNTLAIGGMAAESALGYTEALTREEISEEELTDLSKQLIMNAGGFVVGYKASKLGMKAFNKLVDKKLTETFKTQITDGNRAAALKEVFSDPQKLGNFMEAAGAKIGTDFLVSYAGDLAMMGVLDTHDDWESLLKANLIGIVVGSSGDIKDVANVKVKPTKHNKSVPSKEAGGMAAQQVPGKPELQTDENPGTAGTASKENTVKENNESTSQTQSETISRENTGKQIPAGTVSKAEVSIEQPQTVIKKDNPYGLTQNPLKDIKPKTKEEFAQYLDSLRDIDYKELPRYSAEEKAKLIELFENNNPQYVQYLVDLKECFIKYKYENRFSVDQIEKILHAIKKDEQFTLGLINSVDSKGTPLYSGYEVSKLLASYEKNPDVTKFLVQKQLKSETIEKLASLYQPDSPRYKQLVESGIFDHIKEGKISENVFSDLKENLHLSEDFLNDIKKSRSNQPLVTEIPQGTDLKDIGNFVENGEVGTLNGKLYANQCGNAVELKISREKFEELFPLIKRFNTEQGELGDCWLIAAINEVMSNPSQRADLYKLFTQEGNDILIKFPQSDHVLRFVGGKPYETTEGIEGAGGIKMIEQAFIFERNRGIFSKKQAYTKDQTETDVIARLQENPDLIKYLDGGKQGEFFDALKNSSITFKQFLLHEFPKIFKPKQYHKHLCEWVNNNRSKTVIYSCERGGHTENGREGAALLEYDLYAPHAYTVKDYNPETKTVILQNPHHTNIEIEVPLSVLGSYGSLEFT